MNADPNKTKQQVQRKEKARWIIFAIGCICVLPFCFLVLTVLAIGFTMQGSIGGLGGLQMATAQYTPKDVVGDLGGMPVKIPRHMAEYVEYEGDPGWGQKREGPVPERTYQSKLASFGVQFRYPDMGTLSSPEMWRDKNSKTIFNTDWMRFGIRAGSNYPGNTWLDWLANYNINTVDRDRYIYVKQPSNPFDLKFYLKVNKNTLLPDPRMGTITGESVYIARNEKGQVVTYIECSTVEHLAAPCRHNFSLEFHDVSAKVYVQYRRPLLKNWQDIQDKVTVMILGFKSDPSNIDNDVH